MKHIALYLLLVPFCVSAQLMPQFISGYSDPNDMNKPLDAGYVPSRNYRVDNYDLSDNEIDFDLNSHYIIELDDKFMLRSKWIYDDNIDSTVMYNPYVTDYTYKNGRLDLTTLSRQKINDSILYLREIDSILYNAGHIAIRKTWDIYIPYSAKYRSAAFYEYDSFKRVIRNKPDTKTMDSNTVYAGYYHVDSFTLSNKPIRIWDVSYRYTSENIFSKNSYTLLFYDSFNRLINHKRYSGSYLSDSTVYRYSGAKQYPDTILNFGSDKLLSWKRVYEYTSSGSISQILYYSKRNSGFIVPFKQVYTPIIHSAIAENQNTTPDFQINPNPCKEFFTIVLPEKYTDCSVSISNILGEEVYKQQYTNTTEVSVNPDLKPGMYYVTLNTQLGVLSKKLIIH